MAKLEWGTKRTCQGCGARFYDLGRRHPVCPQCGAETARKPAAKRRRDAAPARPQPPPADETAIEDLAKAPDDDEHGIAGKKRKIKGDEDDDMEDEKLKADDKDQEPIEDTSDLGEDDDDMAEAREHMEEDAEDTA